MPNKISAQKLAESGDLSQYRLVDVRTSNEFADEHIAGSLHMPLDQLDNARLMTTTDRADSQKPLVMVCQSGVRAEQAATALQPNYSGEILVVAGGLNALKRAGIPTVGQKHGVISLQRQVQITAGSLVLMGVLLGMFMNSGFLWLSAFVGAGLIFSGVTGTCGLASLLLKMPWNR